MSSTILTPRIFHIQFLAWQLQLGSTLELPAALQWMNHQNPGAMNFGVLGMFFVRDLFWWRKRETEKLWKKLAAKQELKYIEIEFEQ